MIYNSCMFTILQTRKFLDWLSDLGDRRASARITMRMERMEGGHLGDVRDLGGGVTEMRIDHGPGYRVYFVRRGAEVVILLCGGDKSSQRRDIANAQRMAKEIRHD